MVDKQSKLTLPTQLKYLYYAMESKFTYQNPTEYYFVKCSLEIKGEPYQKFKLKILL